MRGSINSGVAKAYPLRKSFAKFQEMLQRPLLVGTVICIALYFLHSMLGGGAAVAPELTDTVYGCMLDAGSTGSRIHVYRFLRGIGGTLRIEDEEFFEVKPGLSSFASDPRGAADSLRPLLDVAKQYVPAAVRFKAPMALYATAGLRLIDPAAAESILSNVRALIGGTGFAFEAANVMIMDGKKEGVFAWTTVNFLLHNLDPDKPDATTAGIMDLGGGSTQIVFEPSPGSLAGIAVDDVAELSVGGARKRRIFVHSYLGLGLNQAVKRLQAAEGDLCGKRSLEPGREAVRCRQAVRAALLDTVGCPVALSCAVGSVVQPSLDGVDFYAFSYFFDRGQQAGLPVDTVITAAQFGDAAVRICDVQEPAAAAGDAEGKLCTEISFMASLLIDAYGFKRSAPLTIAKRIDGFETSWTLGAMISLLADSRY